MRGMLSAGILPGEERDRLMIRINVAGLIGYSAAAELLREHRQDIESRFSRRFIRDFERLADIKASAREDGQTIAAVNEDGQTIAAVNEDGQTIAAVNEEDRTIAAVNIEDGGLFGSLWQLCEQLENKSDERFRKPVGLRVYVEKIPVRQEVIEICELFGEDPYEAASPEAKLIVWDDRDMGSCPDTFERMAAYGTEIGFITNDNKRILYNGDQIRFLTPFERQMKDMVDRKRHY